MLRFALVLALFAAVVYADVNCEQCTEKGSYWCPSTNECDAKKCSVNVIRRELNCPRLPDAAHAYNDTEARTEWLTLIAAVCGFDPEPCFKNQWPTMKLYRMLNARCSADDNGPATRCHVLTAFDTTRKILVMSFRPTDSPFQLEEEFLDYFKRKVPFFDSGEVYEYFMDAVNMLWAAGLGNDIKTLKYKYPDFELRVTGYSLGAALSSVAASYVVKIGLFDPANVKLLNVGQPRTGDYAYALWQSKTFAYSYRVVHHKDIIPHLPPMPSPDSDDNYHHRYEVWYNNDMKVGKPYQICQEADGPYCSNTQVDLSVENHGFYFDRDIGLWGFLGCPK